MNHHDKSRLLLDDLDTLARLPIDGVASRRAVERAHAAAAALARARRTKPMVLLCRVTLAGAALAVVGLVSVWFTPSRGTDGVAFAQMQRGVSRAKTAQYVLSRTVRLKDGKRVRVISQEKRKVRILGAHQMREEVEVIQPGRLGPKRDSWIYIQNMLTGKTISLDPDTKQYDASNLVLGIDPENSEVHEQQIKVAPEVDFYRKIREAPGEKAKKLPDRMIGGQVAAGFQIVERDERPAGTNTWTGTYWIDPQTKLPLRIEFSRRSTDPTMADSDSTLTDFVFDAPLGEALFSTDPPPGYHEIVPQHPAEKPENEPAEEAK